MGAGLAMKMRLELGYYARRHGVPSANPINLPMAPPSERPIIITGIAASDRVDNERMAFRPFSLTYLPWRLPPLLFRHREPAGTILKLAYDKFGRLIIDARVDHEEARRCNGLSVAATIEAYELRDHDDPNKFHAAITRADITEISLTPSPANPDCVVTMRGPISPASEALDLVRNSVLRAQAVIEQLRQLNNKQPEPAPQQPAYMPKHPNAKAPPLRRSASPLRRATTAPPVELHRTTAFGKFITEMEQAHAGR